MSEFLERIAKLSPQRLALLAAQLNERVEAAEKRRRMPIAIVGMGCRMPGGVSDPEEFWALLREGRDAVVEVPGSRWNVDALYDPNPDTPGKMSTRWGGFIDAPDLFDAKFWGIAPAEAHSMDPQQRLLLETSWEALENAGLAPSSMAGSQTGVFVGICNADYSHLTLRSLREKITPYFAPGVSHAVAAGRISYALGLRGPNLAVDTSCSASLVAVHLACQSLRIGECDAALAGGVNLILNPEITIALSQSRMMAPDGRCKAFSERANGFVRGEGCGMIVLKRLDDAERENDRILAVIRGSATNQDGRSSGLTAPHGPSQEAVVRAALADAGLRPEDIDWIEAHGTGTSLGDPIEAGALNEVFSKGMPRTEPLWVGSVKTNIGHLESAAGVAGLMKLVLALGHGGIPASLHSGELNHRVEWERLPMRVPARLEPWTRRGAKKRAAGVSSFGFSGTNAHLVVEEYRERERPEISGEYLFPLSARTETALWKIAERLRSHLIEHPPEVLADVAYTLERGRSHFEHRAALTAGTLAELIEKLAKVSNGRKSVDIAAGRAAGHAPRIGFVFGATMDGMDLSALYSTAPAFRATVDRAAKILAGYSDRPLRSMLSGDTGGLPQELREARTVALEIALAEQWRSSGIEAAAVMGVGAGEYAAACIAQVFCLEDAMALAIAAACGDIHALEATAREVTYSSPQVSWIGDAGEAIDTAGYWARRRQNDDMQPPRLEQEDCAAWLSIGAADAAALEHVLPGGRNAGEFLRTAAALYVLGSNPARLYPDGGARPTVLPTYPFERERYWLETEDNEERSTVQGPATVPDADWMYELAWEPKPLSDTVQQSVGDREWILFADERGVGEALHARLVAQGERSRMIRRPAAYDDIAALLRSIDETAGVEVVYLWGLDAEEPDTEEALRLGTDLCGRNLLELMQLLLAGGRTGRRLWVATRGAQAAGAVPPTASGAVQSLAWGLGRVLGVESAAQYRALIDLDPAASDEENAEWLLEELLTADREEDQIAWRAGVRLAARLRRSGSDHLAAHTPAKTSLRSDSSYLLTGGLGGVGLRVARWAAEQRPGHLVLLGRTGTGKSAGPFAAERLKAIREIEELGVPVTVVEGDVASLDEMSGLFAQFGAKLPPLRGIFHAATAFSLVELNRMTGEELETMLRAKVQGTWVLDRLSRSLPLDFFLAFSSTSSLLASRGMGHYAAANHFLDTFAHVRRASGQPMLSVDWGVWDIVRNASAKEQQMLSRNGILPLDSSRIFAWFGHLLASPRAQLIVANIDWEIARPLLELHRRRPLIESLGGGKHGTPALVVPATQAAALAAVVEMDAASRKKYLQRFVIEQAAHVLGYREREQPPVDVPLPDLGLDSLMAVDLKNRLQAGLGQQLSPTIVYDYPTILEMVELLETMLWAAHGGLGGELMPAEKDEIHI